MPTPATASRAAPAPRRARRRSRAQPQPAVRRRAVRGAGTAAGRRATSPRWTGTRCQAGRRAPAAVRRAGRKPCSATGDLRPDWLCVGDPPIEEEDRAGQPFAGEPGKLLDNMLAAVGR